MAAARGCEPLSLLGISGIDDDKRIKASLADTELDIPSIRVGGRSNDKIPTLKGWTKGSIRA